MISVVFVNWNSYDFAQLLIESIERFTYSKYEVIIVDNSVDKKRLYGVNLTVLPQDTNVGHGDGLNIGSRFTKGQDVMFVDVDCHFLKPHWEHYFLQLIREYDVIAGRGVPAKPIRPSCMFMKRWIATKYDWRSTPGYKGERAKVEPGFDVAIPAYHKMVEDGVQIKLIESQPSSYRTVNGEEWEINGIPLVYHHWSATYLQQRQADFPNDDLFKDKEKLFSQIPWRML